MTKIKICGIQTSKEGFMAVENGADAVGFVFTNSKRMVSPQQARHIINELPIFTTSVGVFVNEDINRVNEIVEYCNLSYVQLHGEESPEYCEKIKVPYIKTIKVRERKDLEKILQYKAKAYLLDTYIPGQAGGTGLKFDWDIAKDSNLLGKFILAGGLTPENVQRAIKVVKPISVDVSSGVETNGVKNNNKISSFIKAVKETNMQVSRS